MKPTHAIKVLDNWGGEGSIYWLFAYEKEGEFLSCETDSPILEYEGDKIIKVVEL